MVTPGSGAGSICSSLEAAGPEWSQARPPTGFVVWAAFLQSGDELGGHCAITGVQGSRFSAQNFPRGICHFFPSFMQQTCLNAHYM